MQSKKILFSIFVNKLNFWQCKSVLKQSEEDLIKSSKYITHRILCVSFSKKGYLQIRFFNIDWLHTTKSVPQINLSQPTIFLLKTSQLLDYKGLPIPQVQYFWKDPGMVGNQTQYSCCHGKIISFLMAAKIKMWILRHILKLCCHIDRVDESVCSLMQILWFTN